MGNNPAATGGHQEPETEKDQIEEPPVNADQIKDEIDLLYTSMTYSPQNKQTIIEEIQLLETALKYTSHV